MPDAPAESSPPAESAAEPRRKPGRAGKAKPAAETPPKESKPAEAPAKAAAAPKRAVLPAPLASLLRLRSVLDDRRPKFVRQAAHRYYRIGRDGAWRRPRGLQSKQRRHYGYRSEIVRIGYRSPASVRGLVPSGFVPVLVRTREEIERIDAQREAAVIGRTVGTRRRLVLEEVARKRGVHVLNPIVKGDEEE
jgi:large subunit ribosomal protein L32e